MAGNRRLMISFMVALTVTSAAAGAKEADQGYYGSLEHPDFGQWGDKDSGFHKGEGYYGAIEVPVATPAPDTIPSSSVDGTTAVPAAASAGATADTGNQPDLAKLEQRYFGQTYPGESEETRLQRLEGFVFGESKPGDPSSRIAALSKSMATPNSANELLPALPITAGGKHAPANASIAESPAFLLKTGEQLFQQKAFHAAEDSFKQACQKNPRDQNAHYWLALTRMQMYDYDSAKQEMQLAFALNPFTNIGQKARASLMELSEQVDRQQRPPVDSQEQLQQTMRDMRRQAASLQAQKYRDGALAAGWARYSGQLEAQRIRMTYGDFYSRAGRMRRIAINTPYDVSNLATIKSNYILSDTYVRASAARRDAADRQRSIQEYMNSALTELSREPRPGEPHLRAFGTNLYVRYYGNDTPDSPPDTATADPPIKAVAAPYRKLNRQTWRP